MEKICAFYCPEIFYKAVELFEELETTLWVEIIISPISYPSALVVI